MIKGRFLTKASVLCLIVLTPVLVKAQFGNTISGYVFGLQRQPLSEVTVELFDDYSRSLGRTRTNSSGRYIFSRIGSGRFRVRVLSVGIDYEEQEQEVEIQNIRSRDNSGNVMTLGYDNVQRDFYLKLRKSSQTVVRPEAIFVQEIPLQAKQLYKKSIELLDDKKTDEGLKELKMAIEAFPDYFEALERLGSEYVKLKYFLPAQLLLQKAVEVNPRSYRSWYGLAYALYSQNIIIDAVEAAEKANSLNPSSIESPLLTGVLFRRMGKYEQAEKQLKKADDLSKGSVPEVHWHLALLYGNNLNRYEDAANQLELFLKVSPNNRDGEKIKKLIKQFKDKARVSSQK